MNSASLSSPDVIAGPTINAARLNELCSACVELAGAWGGTPDIAHSTPCVCTLPDVHLAMTESGGRVACSVSSSGIRQVKQCLEAVLVAFEVAGCARSLQQVKTIPKLLGRLSRVPCVMLCSCGPLLCRLLLLLASASQLDAQLGSRSKLDSSTSHRCGAWGGENLQHILKSCVQDASSTSDAFSPLSIESDLGISMLQIAHSRLAVVHESIHKAAAEQIWPAAAALEIAWCLLDGVAAATDSSARSFTSSRDSAEALILFCCRHSPLICHRLQSLIPPLIPFHKLMSECARVALCAAFVPWCDHELSSAMLDFRALASEECHMRVLRQAASANSAMWLHFMSHIAALQRRCPRSLFLTAFALSTAAFDASSCSIGKSKGTPSCSSHMAHSTSAISRISPNLAITCKMQGAKRRILSCDNIGNQTNSQGEKSRSSSCGAGPDESHSLRCSYVFSLLRGLDAEISCVRSYISTGGNAFELLPLLHWLLAAEGSKAIDSNGRIGLGQLEEIVRAILLHEGTKSIGDVQAQPCSLLEAIVTVAASDVSCSDNRRLLLLKILPATLLN